MAKSVTLQTSHYRHNDRRDWTGLAVFHIDGVFLFPTVCIWQFICQLTDQVRQSPLLRDRFTGCTQWHFTLVQCLNTLTKTVGVYDSKTFEVNGISQRCLIDCARPRINSFCTFSGCRKTVLENLLLHVSSRALVFHWSVQERIRLQFITFLVTWLVRRANATNHWLHTCDQRSS